MDYKCTVCGDVVPDNLKDYIDHTENHIVDIIKEKHPDWVEESGICHKCHEYYKEQMKGG